MTQIAGLSQHAIGRYLVDLREEAGFRTPAELASKVPLSEARLTRMESGETDSSAAEVLSVLGALKPFTPKAQALSAYLTEEWELLTRPAFDHPDRATLWQAHGALRILRQLRAKSDIKGVFLRQVDLYEQELHRVTDFLLARDHHIAAVGAIGVGKTTALCTLAGLVNRTATRFERGIVLETGAGGITLCEVRIANGPNYGLRIVPRAEDDIRKDVEDFAEYVVQRVHPERERGSDDGDGLGISREVVRALRNMSGLTETRREEGGRQVRIDAARDLVAQFPEPKELAIQIMTRMDLLRRQQREAWYRPEDGVDALAWLQDLFSRVNNGRHGKFTLPAKIEVVIPGALLGSESLPIAIVDTKGVDQTAERQDLETQFDDERTLVVLCTRFNDSPDVVAQTLLKRAREAGANQIEAKTVILVLPHPEEALAMKHDSGMAVSDAEEGYELKKEQIHLRLQGLGLSRIPIMFFNAKSDPPEPVRHRLVEHIAGYRKRYCVQVGEIVTAVRALEKDIENENIRLVFEQACHRLSTWINAHRELQWKDERIQQDLIQAIDGTRYAATVRASIRRLGEWDNLDYYHHLAVGVRRIGVQLIGTHVAEFKVIVNNLINDVELGLAVGFLTRLVEKLDSAVDTAYRRIQVEGREAFLSTLQADHEYWATCEALWGGGKGYRASVSKETDSRIAEQCDNARAMVRHLVEREWRELVGLLDAMLQEKGVGAPAMSA